MRHLALGLGALLTLASVALACSGVLPLASYSVSQPVVPSGCVNCFLELRLKSRSVDALPNSNPLLGREMALHKVTNQQELAAAFAAAESGSVIELSTGNYGTVVLKDKAVSGTITIVAATPGAAHFDGLRISNVDGLSIQGVGIGRALANEPDYTPMATIYGSSRVSLDHVEIHGSEDGNPNNDGRGIVASGVNDLTVSNTQFHDLRLGMMVEKSSLVRIRDNGFYDLGLDGVQIAGSKGIVVARNLFDRFFPNEGDHPDAIQIYNTNQPQGSSDITIEGNILLQTAGKGPQGIFIAAPGEAGFSNVLIKNNLMYGNDLWNGITVEGGRGVSIIGNTVLSSTADNKQFWIRLQSTKDVTVANNIMDDLKILPGVENLIQSNNLLTRQASASELANLNLLQPQSSQDLIFPDRGYQSEESVTLGSAAGALAGSLTQLLGGTSGGQTTEQMLATGDIEPESNTRYSPLVFRDDANSVPFEAAALFPRLPTIDEYFVALP